MSISQFIPLWWERCLYPDDDSPLLQRAHGMEEEAPWRKGYAVVLRVPRSRRAIALGIWTSRQPSTDDGDGPMLELRQMEKWW